MNPILESLKARKSVRAYEDLPITGDVRHEILNAALEAPSAGNMAHYAILEITDPELKARLAITCDNQPFIASAPWVLVFVTDLRRYMDAYRMAGENPRAPGEGDLLLAMSDALIAAQNTVVAAEALGVGSCYIGDILERYEDHREMLNLPKWVLPVAMLCFGYPTPQQKARKKPRRFALSDIVHENTYVAKEGPALEGMLSRWEGKEGEALSASIAACCRRKYDSDFSREMTRSVRAMIGDFAREE